MSEHRSSPLARRSFLTQVGTGVTVLGAAATVGGPPAVAAQGVEVRRWQPERHSQDDWLDQIQGKHRLVFDTTESSGMDSALRYATNYYSANNTGYGLQNSDLAVVIIARHFSTPYAYDESIWNKYGVQLSDFTEKGKPPSMRNTYGRQLNTLIERGTHLAVCQLATRAIASMIAPAFKSTADDVYNEIAAHLLTNSHLVPAGIVAVNRAQERGYALVHAV